MKFEKKCESSPKELKGEESSSIIVAQQKKTVVNIFHFRYYILYYTNLRTYLILSRCLTTKVIYLISCKHFFFFSLPYFLYEVLIKKSFT